MARDLMALMAHGLWPGRETFCPYDYGFSGPSNAVKPRASRQVD